MVLADVTMGGTGGLAIARHVQAPAGSRAAAVLLMAGQPDVVDHAANAAADVRGVVHTPLDSLQLIESVREVLRTGRPPRRAPALVQEVARLVVADVSERLVREEIARMRSAHVAR